MDDDRIARLACLYQAIGDPTRLRILGLLAERPRTGKELSDDLGLTPPTISHHMARLTDVGLVSATPEAQRRIYRLDFDALRAPLISDEDEANSAVRTFTSDPDATRVLRDFFDGELLRCLPAQRKKRVIVLRRLLERFAPDRAYPEREVNDLLRTAHDDVATLRRELVDYGFLTRDAGVYRVARQLPERGATVAQETGGDEPEWFAALLAGATRRVFAGDSGAGSGED